jgi:hypothetical protein
MSYLERLPKTKQFKGSKDYIRQPDVSEQRLEEIVRYWEECKLIYSEYLEQVTDLIAMRNEELEKKLLLAEIVVQMAAIIQGCHTVILDQERQVFSLEAAIADMEAQTRQESP